ncbi:MAG: ADP-ribosylglycohydrolase family protein [Armatimonadota bacterium]
MPSLSERIHGALLGAAIGAELSFAACAHPERVRVEKAQDLLNLTLEPAGEYQEETGRINARPLTPFINLGVQTYLRKGGRAVPEDFAALLKDDEAIAGPVFSWDGVHSTQEVLREGMHPRISGMGNAPCGLIAASMPAVGIFHFADPEYAYLDGVELASVAQPRLGADWAGLCAAAVAAALDTDATPETVVNKVLKIAHTNAKEVFYQINYPSMLGGGMRDEAALADWWYHEAGRGRLNKETLWVAFNPIASVLPLLPTFGGDAQKFMALLIGTPCANWLESMGGGRLVPAIIGGAILGALGGPEAFPEEWRAWAEPAAAAWLPITDVVKQRAEKEREILTITERIAAPRPDGASLLFDKVYGNILAGAIGNAMGSVVEGRMYWEIDAQHPGGVQTILDPRRLESEDDNQMAMLLTETYIERDGLPVLARHFGKTWHDRLNRDHFFALCMGNAYDLIRAGWDPRITGHWSVVTGSTVMCMEPVGIYHTADPDYAAIDATAVSYMYQRGLDNVAATMLAATVAEALKAEATVDSVLQAALNATSKQPLHTFDTRKFASAYDYISACLEVAAKYDDVLAVRAELYEKCLLYHMIDPLELWGFALAMFKVANGDVRLSAIGGTNIGRDSDTISGRAAMLSGTLRGAASVPADWTAMFSEDSLERIKRNAGRFTELIVKKKLGRLRQRQAAAEVPAAVGNRS